MFKQRYASVIALLVAFMLPGITTVQALPELVINDFTVSASAVELGKPFSATVTMANQGTSNVPIPETGQQFIILSIYHWITVTMLQMFAPVMAASIIKS